MKVYSVPGKGTTFKLLFPATGVVRTPPSHIMLPSDAQGSGTILVVDDEEIVRDTARNTLERYGYRILMARDGREAIELFREVPQEIALVLLDLTMPYMNGEEVLREMQAIRPPVRVLLSSGFNEVEAVRRFTGKGLAGFIQKPYTSMALAEKIKQVLQP
jgi:DNA-binding NtrC family response regulator